MTTTPPVGASARRGPLRDGDRVQLTDAKGRPHTIILSEGKTFHTHRGSFEHSDLIGRPEGTVVRLERDVEERDRYGRLLAYVHRQIGRAHV